MISPIRNFRRLLRRLLKDVRGGEAIEMAIVGAPFVALIFATIELGLVFLVSTTLESATDEMSHQIRTGALQTTAGSANTFKASICDNMSWLGATCAANLNVDVRSFASFTGQATPPNPVAGGKVDPVKFCWDPGGAGSVVLVRAYYTWTLVLPVLNVGLQSAGMPGKRLITTATSFRNEPYTTTTQAPATCPSLP